MFSPIDNKPISSNTALQIFTSDSEQFLTYFWEFFSLVAIGDIQFSRKLYDHLSTIETHPWQAPMIEIGRTKFLSITGHLFKAHKNFQKISQQVYTQTNYPSVRIRNEITAFLNYEKSLLAAKMKDYHQAEIYLHAGNNLTSIDKFSLAFELQLEIFRTKHDQPNLARLENSIIKLEAAGIPALACIGWRNAGIISRKLKEFSKAAKYYKTALSLATKHDLSLLRTQIYIALATLNSNMGNYNAAREALNKVKFSESLDPIIPSKFEILAVIESHEGNVANSIELVKQALEINLKLDNVALLPAECMHLGEAYENHFKNLDQAEYYYKIGYDHCIRYAENGISLTGDRKQVVDAYVRLLKLKDKSSPSSTKHSHQDPFTFSEGKPWKQIKDIFQHQLILHHSLDQRNSKSMARKLALPPTTLYSLQDRLKQRGYLLPQKGVTTTEESHELSGFIQQHTDLSWGEINKIFEREIMHHLYEKYGYNKHRMASILKISYPSIIKMTRELTQVDEHLLPN